MAATNDGSQTNRKAVPMTVSTASRGGGSVWCMDLGRGLPQLNPDGNGVLMCIGRDGKSARLERKKGWAHSVWRTRKPRHWWEVGGMLVDSHRSRGVHQNIAGT